MEIVPNEVVCAVFTHTSEIMKEETTDHVMGY